MRHHPVTPMEDAHLGRLIERQGGGKAALIAWPIIDQGPEAVAAALAAKRSRNGSSVNSMDKFAANFGMVLSQFIHFVSGQVTDLAIAEGKHQPRGLFQLFGIVGGFAQR